MGLHDRGWTIEQQLSALWDVGELRSWPIQEAELLSSPSEVLKSWKHPGKLLVLKELKRLALML